MPVRIFDTHTHYNFETAFGRDLPEVMKKIAEAGVERDAVIGCDVPSSFRAAEMAKEDQRHLAVAGIHPQSVTADWRRDLYLIAPLAGLSVTEDSGGELRFMRNGKNKAADEPEKLGEPQIVAVGEIGLDHFRLKPEETEKREWQKEAFRAQLRMAEAAELPVVIHSREAALETFTVLEEEGAGKYGGVIHCYSYSREMAERFLKLGFYLGIGGTVTRPAARKIRETVEAVPLEFLVLETDCPYLSPVGWEMGRNDSASLWLVAEKIAELKGVTPEEVCRVTWENACRLYRQEA